MLFFRYSTLCSQAILLSLVMVTVYRKLVWDFLILTPYPELETEMKIEDDTGAIWSNTRGGDMSVNTVF